MALQLPTKSANIIALRVLLIFQAADRLRCIQRSDVGARDSAVRVRGHQQFGGGKNSDDISDGDR